MVSGESTFISGVVAFTPLKITRLVSGPDLEHVEIKILLQRNEEQSKIHRESARAINTERERWVERSQRAAWTVY